jgi:GDP-4-dehydro-6-deoxy-D-mannose reductase
MAKIFITGINGFVGKHLIDEYKEDEIFGLVKDSTGEDLGGNVKTFQGDILDSNGIEKIIAEVKPDIIFHLAALTSPAESLKNPVETINNNVSGQLNILEAVRNLEIDCKMLVVSSAEVYGNVDEKNIPTSENSELLPNTPYGVSKATQDLLGYQYYKSYGLKNVRVRPFNHIGPGQAPVFVVSAFARQIAMIEKGQQEKVIKVGNLSPKRDFTDVRDVVKAYKFLMEKGKFGEVYNIGSGKSYEISEILNILMSFSTEKIEVVEDPLLARSVDVKELRCDFTKLKNDTGWEPEIPIEKSLQDTLDYWRDII